MDTYKKYITEAVTEEQLKAKILKIGDAAQRLTIQRFKLEDRLEKIHFKIYVKRNLIKKKPVYKIRASSIIQNYYLIFLKILKCPKSDLPTFPNLSTSVYIWNVPSL